MAETIIGSSPTTGEILVKKDNGDMEWRKTDKQTAEKVAKEIETTGKYSGGVSSSGGSSSSSGGGSRSSSSGSSGSGSSGSKSSSGTIPAYEIGPDGNFYYNPDNTAGIENFNNLPVMPKASSGGGGSSSSGGSSSRVIPAYEIGPDGNFYYNPDNTAGIENFNNLPVRPGASTGGTNQNVEGPVSSSRGDPITYIPDYGADYSGGVYGGLGDLGLRLPDPISTDASRVPTAPPGYRAVFDPDYGWYYQPDTSGGLSYEDQLNLWLNTYGRQGTNQLDWQTAQNELDRILQQRLFEAQLGLSRQQQDWLQDYQQQQMDYLTNPGDQSQFGRQLALDTLLGQYQNEYWQGQLANQRAQQQIDQNNYLANLAANPINWLQYNQAAGMPTVSQPFMQELGGSPAGTVIAGAPGKLFNPPAQMPAANPGGNIPALELGSAGIAATDNYYDMSTRSSPTSGLGIAPTDNYYDMQGRNPSSATSSLGIAATDNYYDMAARNPAPSLQDNQLNLVNPTGGTSRAQPVGTPNQLNLGEMNMPSAQYWARMTPTERSLYQGYERARTGASPADLEQAMWMRSAPKGGTSLTYR